MLQLKRKKAAIIRIPPTMAADDRGWPVRNQSTIATRKIVRSAATDDRTGDVREMSTKNDPENASHLLVL